jgi:hypothetical protein
MHARHLLALCVLMTSSALADALSTAFSYQGQLLYNGSPANGSFDFKFDLYTAATGGVSYLTLTKAAFPVSNGLLDTTLDYSQVPFNGQALWIEVSVRPAGSGAYTVLGRQSINVTPYAVYALQSNGGGGSLTLPYSNTVNTSGTAFAVTNSGTGKGIFGAGTSGNAVEGSSNSADGVHGTSTSAAGVFGGSSTGAGVWGDSQTWDGVHGVTHNPNNNTSGVAGFGDGGNFGVFGLSTSGDGVHGGSTSNAGVSGGSTSGTGVYGNSTNGAGVWGDSGSFDGVHGHTSNPNDAVSPKSGVAGFGDGHNIGVYGASDSGWAIYGYSKTGVTALFEADPIVPSLVIAAIANGQNLFHVASTGNVYAHGSFVSNGIDYADRLPAEPGIETADVVVIGEDGVLHRSSRANETDVAGVYSTRPGVLGQHEEETRATIPVALAGVVPVKAVVENGAIHPGDLLVSSSSPGRAMRAPADPRPGTVIGKAMQRLEAGEGQITMLVWQR